MQQSVGASAPAPDLAPTLQTSDPAAEHSSEQAPRQPPQPDAQLENLPDHDSDAEPGVELDADADGEPDPEVSLLVKWSGSTYPVELPARSTVVDLKNRLFELTEVMPKRQKVLGLPSSSGRLPTDTLILESLNLKPDHRLMLVGSREAAISAANDAYLNVAIDIVNDFDVDYDPDSGSHRILCDVAYHRVRLERRILTTEVRIMNEPRPDKKLLVLDLDYTLFDCRSDAPTIAELGRPGLHRFLASAYRYYDIVVWSQTSWRWLEAKLTGLSMLFANDYRLSFVLDRTSMFEVTSKKGRHERKHEVKALEIIWRKFSGRWSARNTIHIDDLSKNFALNPQSGLKIHAFKNAPVNRATDRELFYLEYYLRQIAQREQDFTTLKHRGWRGYCAAIDPDWESHIAVNDVDPPSQPPE